MIRRFLVLLALLTLTFVSAATAHEHGMDHTAAAPIEAKEPAAVTLPMAAPLADQAAAWLAVSGASVGAAANDVSHAHGKYADCACPAACAGLFNIEAAAASLHLTADAAGTPSEARRLLALSAAPPTPPPRA
ncbi:exported hypothetical protein [uncultured Pleomorphomonas sp.]|uniref:Uncharacterized protein n=1 Tax=uncultured Pleomorphomonas sp. TaxID=442121 RepID=A0A212L899_9HYPH|nr:hypothetical protein [uncultured Pleomorphomonas sp.]SCM73803.1 exported hypothetical protein [uncultured Pleomorphomonas sp.]